MAVIELTKDNFEAEVLKSEVPVLVDFFASWCGPCQMMGPIFDEVSADYEGKLKFGKVSTESDGELAQKYGIQSIPCFVLFKGGEETERVVGGSAKDVFKTKIDSLLGK
ncbi:MAG: thioredoxin [Nanoarchaeota archaeon]|nr:thioredoxin [Nanoarchaeota archaeon]